MTSVSLTRAAKFKVNIVFSEPMNARRAANSTLYQVQTLPGNGGPSVNLRVASVKYSAGAQRVTLTFVGKLAVTDHVLLTITASGLPGKNGLLLDGDNDGNPGGNFSASLS